MPLFEKHDDKVAPVRSIPFEKESTLQELTEHNLQIIFGLTFIATEFPVKGLFIDSLAFDEEAKSFVIIEYKKTESFSVIDQGFAYLSLMLENKSDFLVEYNEKLKKNLQRSDIDWSQARVLFVSPSFTRHQLQAINFKDLPIELWEVERYTNNCLLFREVKKAATSASISGMAGNIKIKEVTKEVKVFTIDDHLRGKPDSIRSLFEEFTDGLQRIDASFELHPVKTYVGYYKGGYNLVEIRFQNKKIVLSLLRAKPGQLHDPAQKMQYWKNSMKMFNKDISNVDIVNSSDVAYALILTKELLEKYRGKIGSW